MLGRRTMVWAGMALAACGGSNPGTPDAGPPPDLEPLAAFEEQNANTPDAAFVSRALDYACLGERSRPVGGDPVAATFQLRDFQDDFEVNATDLWLFTDNVIADACAPPHCTEHTTDANGNASVMLPAGGWYAYRVLPKMGLSLMTTVFGVFQYNEPAPAAAGGTVIGNSVSGSTIDLIPALVGTSRTEGLAIVAGRIEDCAGGFVQNAVVRIYDADGAEVTQGALNDDPHFHYFNGDATDNTPDQERAASNADGLYVLMQIPVADERPYRMEAWGNLDGELVMLACESARIFPDAVTILNLTPLRADAPSACR